MSLLEEAMEQCTMIDKVSRPDGQGGTIPVWVDGAKFRAAIAYNTTMQARMAEKQGVTALYTVTTRKNTNLQFREIFRRESDGKIFRVTSDGDDNHTPASAGLNMRNVTAEEYQLPNE